MGPTKFDTRNCTVAKLPPQTTSAGQTPRTPRQPDMTHTSQTGMSSEKNGSWRPAMALSGISPSFVTVARVRIGVPSAPYATGAVLANSDKPAARSGLNPAPMSSAAEIATGVPKPAAPSTKAPKQNAINKACKRRSAESETTECLTRSNWPASTVRLYRKIAANTIQPIGKSPNAAPLSAAANIVCAHAMRPTSATSGGVKTNTATSQAVTSPASAAFAADTRPVAKSPNSTTTGNAATSGERRAEPHGS
jgi:hypothetical protein